MKLRGLLILTLAGALGATGCFSELEESDEPTAAPAVDAGTRPAEVVMTRVCSRPAEQLCMVWASPKPSQPPRCGASGLLLPAPVGDAEIRERSILELQAAESLSTDAELVLALRLRERAANIAPPTGLDFTPGKEEPSKERFTGWLRQRKQAMSEVTTLLKGLVERPGVSADQQARAAQVMAGLYADFALHLETFEVPANITRGKYAADAQQAFCDALSDAAEPLWQKSLQAVAECQRRSPSGVRCEALVAGVGVQQLRRLRAGREQP